MISRSASRKNDFASGSHMTELIEVGRFETLADAKQRALVLAAVGINCSVVGNERAPKREFLLGHVERVIYNRYKVRIAGSVPVQSASGETKLRFRIEGEIDRKAVRSRPRTTRAEEVQRTEWTGKGAAIAVETWPNFRSERRSGRATARLPRAELSHGTNPLRSISA